MNLQEDAKSVDTMNVYVKFQSFILFFQRTVHSMFVHEFNHDLSNGNFDKGRI